MRMWSYLLSGLGPGGIGKGASPLYLLAMVLADESDEEELAEVVASTVSCTMPDGMTHYPDVASNTKDVATGVTFGNSKLTSPAIRAALVKLLTVDKRRVLSMSLGDLPGYSGPFPPCTIRMTHDRPVFERRRMHSALEQQIENEKCGEMLAARLIEPSLSAHYASNLTFPAKKDVEGGYTDRRMCMDLRAVNDATEFDRYNMPHPDVALAVILGSKVFSILDLRSGYHQIPILEIDRDKTSFWWGPKLYRYSRMVMGRRNLWPSSNGSLISPSHQRVCPAVPVATSMTFSSTRPHPSNMWWMWEQCWMLWMRWTS